jgi:hypothetical protein
MILRSQLRMTDVYCPVWRFLFAAIRILELFKSRGDSVVFNTINKRLFRFSSSPQSSVNLESIMLGAVPHKFRIPASDRMKLEQIHDQLTRASALLTANRVDRGELEARSQQSVFQNLIPSVC